MGHSRAEKDKSHDRIVRVAAGRFREAGISGVAVADLMKEAGLTHGGFYRHFASRDDLVAEAIERALHDGGLAVDALATRAPERVRTTVEAPILVDEGLITRRGGGLFTGSVDCTCYGCSHIAGRGWFLSRGQWARWRSPEVILVAVR